MERSWRWVGVLLVATRVFAPVAAYFQLPFNTTKFFGPDGPWQGISLGAIYQPGPGTVIPLTLLPVVPFEAYAAIFVPTAQACISSADPDCGAGGIIAPLSNATGNTWVSFTDYQSHWGYNFTGTQRIVNLSLPDSYTQHYAIAVAAGAGTNYSYPNGRTLGPETGIFSLGASPAAEDVSLAKSLHESGVTQSNSFGMHIGAAALNYPGSLILGGYDEARVIAPVVSYSAGDSGTVQLQDISIGVETGGSPFSFGSKSGLLRGASTDTAATPLQAYVLANVPYLYGPEATVNAITSLLPVQYDSSSGYYLWDTTDPLYKKIVTSPAYLGFTFNTSPGATTQTTIKVPFSLLNLTLEPSVTGYDSARAYFPIMKVDDTLLVQPSIWLGRAFLQAAFYGTNWGNNQTWIAQAPGPGANNDGLGSTPQDLASSATTISTSSGSNLFEQSWSNHWTVLAGGSKGGSPAASSPAVSSSAAASGSGSSGLSGGDIAGIVVGVVVGLGLIAGLIAFVLLRRRRRYKAAATEDPHEQQQTEYKPPVADNRYAEQHPAEMSGQPPLDESMPKYGHTSNMGSPPPQLSQLHYDSYGQQWSTPSELPTSTGAKELSGESAGPPAVELPAGDASNKP